MFCTNCGTQLPEGTKFCTNCGAPQLQAEPVVSEASARFEQPASQPEAETAGAEGYSQSQGDDSQPQGGFDQPVYNAESARPLKSMTPYLTWAIIVTVLCCWPLGIPAIVYASKINRRNDEGDYAGAEDAASKAKTWTIVSAIVGFVFCGVLSAIALF